MPIIKKWMSTLLLVFVLYSTLLWAFPVYKKCIIYFNIISYFISILFFTIILFAEKQTPAKKLTYTLGAIGNKFLLSIIAFVAYFYVLNQQKKVETLLAFGIYFTYFVLSYYFLYQLNKKKN